MKNYLALALGTVIVLVLAVFFIQPSWEEKTPAGEYDGAPDPWGVSSPEPPKISPAPVNETLAVRGTVKNTKTTEETRAPGGDTMITNSATRIKMTFNDEEVLVWMQDNPTSRDFLSLLPLTVSFEDYSGTEKIARLSKRLSVKEAPAGSDPSVGDFTYYSPWGNIAIFYRDFGYADGLVILGSVEPGGVEKLARMNGSVAVTLERVE